MKSVMPTLLVMNGGSSSIRFALYETDNAYHHTGCLLMSGKVECAGLKGASFIVSNPDGSVLYKRDVDSLAFEVVVDILLDWLVVQPVFETIQAVGHRVVHGMTHAAPQRVTPELLNELYKIIPFDPVHLPCEIELITAIQERHPALSQVVCFDTAFHSGMPRVATIIPIPRHYETKGVRRYGFHGLSYSYLMEELEHLGDPTAKTGRVILAHLGNGASMVAVRNGKSIDTTMGFTPVSGLVMGTRSGDLDPGLMSFMARSERMTVLQFEQMINYQSGLLGISETSSDLRDLLAVESHDERAAEAIALFCYQAKKTIGSFAAVLGGLDTLVFTGGIGENSTLIRERICEGLDFLGIEINKARNEKNMALISSNASRVSVRVIPADEERMIARSVCHVISEDTISKKVSHA